MDIQSLLGIIVFVVEKLISSVYKIMQKDSKFKALMVQKISFMEVKVTYLNNYSIKQDSLINLIKSNKK